MKPTKTLKAVFTVGGLTAFSRVLGFVREMLQSRLIGAGVEQSAFTLAFAIPNMARKLFGEGALTAAFVPIFKEDVERRGLEEAAKLARAVMTMMLLMVGAIVAIAFSGTLVASCVTVLPDAAYRYSLTLGLVAILLPYMLAICGAAFGMGVLNSLGRFKAPGLMPALLNVIWIAALVLLLFLPSLSLRARIVVIAAAILVGGFAQFAFMLYCMAKAGVKPYLDFSGWRSPSVQLVWRNTFIAAIGAGAVQVNYMLDQVLGQYAAPWAAGVIGYAERLMDLPLGVVGVAFGTVLLPTFAGHFAKGDEAGASAALRTAIRNMLIVMVPASIVMAIPFFSRLGVSIVYQGGQFDATATLRVARALSVYGLGLAFFGIQKCLIPFFQARKDMKTPLHVSLVTVALNAALNVLAVVVLPQEWRHVGLAGSTSFCAVVGCVLLALKLKERHG